MNITQQQRQDLTLAVVAGEHQIDADCIRLHRDPTQEGSALSQLVDRVAAVVAQSAPDLDTMRTDFHQWCATNGYKTGFVNGGECPMGRPVYEDHRTHAAWWAFQKAAKLYGAQSAQPALRIAPDETVKDAEVIRLIEESGALLAAYEPRVWLVNLKDVRALLAEAGRLAAQAAPTEPKHPLLNITAKQLRAALDFANPDPDDPDQLEAKVCIQWGEARDDGDGGTEPAGLRAWLAECPEEGSISLDLWGTEGGLV